MKHLKHIVCTTFLFIMPALTASPNDVEMQESSPLVTQLEAKNNGYSTTELSIFTATTASMSALALSASYNVGSGCQNIPQHYTGCVVTTGLLTAIGLPLAACTLVLGSRVVKNLYHYCCGSQENE